MKNLKPEEFLNRVIYDPEWLDDDGKLTPAAISVSDLKKNGLSVNRDFVKAGVVDRLIQDAMAKLPNDREIARIWRMVTNEVTGIKAVVPNKKWPKGEEKKVENIFSAHASPQPEDTSVNPAFPENLAHAHILCLHKGDGTIKALRAELLPLLNNVISVSKFMKIIAPHQSDRTQA
ncbi:MAG: hypothetical protein ACK4U0_06795 [Mesorhizobium sp.]